MPDDLMGHIEETQLADALGQRYLAYALSTIMSRSLPDVRDGLKPVQRRLVYAMHLLHLDPGAGFKKCARVVGDVIGRFHPHGDAAVYEALVRLAQDFAVRYLLVEGQGNFGNVDGDSAAAMRYTEARLTPVARALLDGIDEDAVDFRPNYDSEEREPEVLPASFPNLLANGATGIAVGMASAIPPHNAAEIAAAAAHLIRNPQATMAELLDLMPGPDFPTGGVLAEDPATIKAAYESGRGSFRLRAAWHVEKGKHGTWQIVVTEIPYQVAKARLIEEVAGLIEDRKLPLLSDIRDESTESVRLVLEPRSRGVDPEQLMETLFRASALESRIVLNMNVLDAAHTPRVMSLREILRAWLDHRHVVFERRTRHRLSAIDRRLEILVGYLVALFNLDEVIRIIREHDEPRAALMARFSFSETQAESILNMRLKSLRRLEEIELRREHEALEAERRELHRLLADPRRCWARIAEEIEAMGRSFADSRRTRLAGTPRPVAIAAESVVERQPITAILSEKGWIRAVKGHLADGDELRFKEGDRLRFLLPCESVDRLTLLASNGRAYSLCAADLPRGRGDGQPLRLLAELDNEDDAVTLFVANPGTSFLIASSGGRGFLVGAEHLTAEKRGGRQVLMLKPGEETVVCVAAEGDHVAVVGENRKLLIFPLNKVPKMVRGAGVILQRYREGGLIDAKVFRLAEGLTWRLGGKTRIETDLAPWLGARGQTGRPVPPGFPRSGRFG